MTSGKSDFYTAVILCREHYHKMPPLVKHFVKHSIKHSIKHFVNYFVNYFVKHSSMRKLHYIIALKPYCLNA